MSSAVRGTPTLLGLPYDASSSFLKGTAAAPPLIRQALHSPAGNPWTEMGVDLGADGALGDAGDVPLGTSAARSEEHTSELQSQSNLVCRLLLEKKKQQEIPHRDSSPSHTHQRDARL